MFAPTLLLALASQTPAHAPAAPSLRFPAPPGYAVSQHAGIASGSVVATIAGDEVLVFEPTAIARVDLSQGGARTVLATFAPPVYPSFAVVEPDLAHAVVGESTNHDLLRVDLATGALAPVANVQLNFAAALEDPGHLLVSAATQGFFQPNEILRVPIAGGAPSLVARVPGASGPLARAANGDLYYSPQAATIPQPDSVAVVRWTRAQVESGAVLGLADATTFASGFDGVAAIAVDPWTQHVFVAESRYPGVSDVHEHAADGSYVRVAGSEPAWISSLELVRVAGAGAFQPFQPAGVVMRRVASDFGLPGWPSYLETLETVRASLSATASGAGTTIRIEGAHPLASVAIASAPLASLVWPEQTTYQAPVWFHSALPASAWAGGLVVASTDASGHAVAQLPAGAGPTVYQALVLDAPGNVVGTSAADVR